ncbi:16S rRNA (uracil1498-N3)-methyltransferase [Spiroplasma sp. TIUS-1]|uniref:RsmE family RNA methyltransferase n=1 Tax=Spiroplasma sp. TIUS-1 TaxID=216963 RepID=UPI00139903CC|nr:RsmE family RNA methyltransferase [Spiroplasma sp. TIUS-1]QHX35953.1 16S rRNA (uracil1498-N3)-methyltransferase [Spiroplasma sp. TIUS-1]
MYRYFINKTDGDKFIINDNDIHHIKNVVKLNVGEKIECVFQNNAFLCEILEIHNNYISAKNVHLISSGENLVKKTLLMGMIREQKWDYLIQKAVELGVDEIVPVVFKRNIVKIEPKKESSKLIRWQSIIDSAAKQSKRLTIPQIKPILRNIKDFRLYRSDINVVAWEEERSLSLKHMIGENMFTSISFVVGPEGGIEDIEIKELKGLGFEVIHLGRNILRAETAPLYILSSLIFEER